MMNRETDIALLGTTADELASVLRDRFAHFWEWDWQTDQATFETVAGQPENDPFLLLIDLDQLSREENRKRAGEWRRLLSSYSNSVVALLRSNQFDPEIVNHFINAGNILLCRPADLERPVFWKAVAAARERCSEQLMDLKLRSRIEKKLILEYTKTQKLLDSLNLGIMISVATENGADNNGSNGTNGTNQVSLSEREESIPATAEKIQDINHDLLDLFGIRANDLLGQSVRDLADPTTSPLDEEIRPFLELEEDLPDYHHMSIFEIGQKDRKYIKRMINPFRSSRGQYLGRIWIFLDVTAEAARGYLDPLTGLYNRRYLENNLFRELQRQHRFTENGRQLAVLMIDLDNFKQVNDNRGHLEGDRVLRVVGQILQGSIRNVDFAARYGGEEFTVILPNTSGEQAEVVAEKILGRLRDYDFGPGFRVTTSIGIASRRETEDPTGKRGTGPGSLKRTVEEEMSELLERADKALYQAKRGGKDRFMNGDLVSETD